jgi:hypothetical protein
MTCVLCALRQYLVVQGNEVVVMTGFGEPVEGRLAEALHPRVAVLLENLGRPLRRRRGSSQAPFLLCAHDVIHVWIPHFLRQDVVPDSLGLVEVVRTVAHVVPVIS